MDKKQKYNSLINDITGTSHKLDIIIEYYEDLLIAISNGLLIDSKIIYSKNFKEDLKLLKSVRYNEKNRKKDK